MKQHHKKLIIAGLVALAVGWFAWMTLLTESDEPAMPAAQQNN